MAATIKQIAQEAGVSCGTVDRALHGRPGVNAKVAARILEIARKYDYRPNTFAKALANSGKNRKIAVLVHAYGNEFYSEVVSGMEAAAAEYSNYGIELEPHFLKGYDAVRQYDTLKEIASSAPTGLIITPIDDGRIAGQLSRMSKNRTLVVTLNADIADADRFCYVGCDYYSSGQTAAALFGMMFPKGSPVSIVIVAGSLRQSGHKQRIKGFNDAIKNDYPNITVSDILENDDDNELSQRLIRRLYTERSAPDGIYFCAGGISGGLKAVREFSEAHPPRIITVDETGPVRRALQDGTVQATITQDPFRQGYQAVKVICDKALFGTDPSQQSIIMQNEVKLRYHILPQNREE